jgi:succinate dehydrogenase hydrophobic anchor subunit
MYNNTSSALQYKTNKQAVYIDQKPKTHHKNKMITQRISGLILLIISVVVIIMAAQGTTTQDRDITAVLFLLPISLWMLVSKKCILKY